LIPAFFMMAVVTSAAGGCTGRFGVPTWKESLKSEVLMALDEREH